jgi:hypothetical protein
MGRGGSWTRLHQAVLAAAEDPIIGIDQRSTDDQVKLYNTFCDLDPSSGRDQYRKRSMAAVFSVMQRVSRYSRMLEWPIF